MSYLNPNRYGWKARSDRRARRALWVLVALLLGWMLSAILLSAALAAMVKGVIA